MVRIAYFGTDGCPGHYAIPIRGKFTEEDIKVIESVDCDDFYKVFDVMRFKIAEFKGWTILGIPASLDDHRPGSKTVIFIEGEANEADYITFKGNGKESFSFNVILVKQLIETFEIMLQDIYSNNYKLKVYAGNCIAQLSVNPKDSSESFFDVYDKDETKLIYGIEIGILKEMFGI